MRAIPLLKGLSMELGADLQPPATIGCTIKIFAAASNGERRGIRLGREVLNEPPEAKWLNGGADRLHSVLRELSRRMWNNRLKRGWSSDVFLYFGVTAVHIGHVVFVCDGPETACHTVRFIFEDAHMLHPELPRWKLKDHVNVRIFENRLIEHVRSELPASVGKLLKDSYVLR
jgi:hypothetical protein